jgi:hypothetical protein
MDTSPYLRLPKQADLSMETARGGICAVNCDMNSENKEEQAVLWQAAVVAIGRALRHEYENQQEEMPEHRRQLVTQLEISGKPQQRRKQRLSKSWSGRVGFQQRTERNSIATGTTKPTIR